jgi:hypothetical protein
MLEAFKLESGELNSLKSMKNDEQATTTKLIKNEVIDMADRLEDMENLMIKQAQ